MISPFDLQNISTKKIDPHFTEKCICKGKNMKSSLPLKLFEEDAKLFIFFIFFHFHPTLPSIYYIVCILLLVCNP